MRAEVALRAAVEQETVKGDLKGAIEAYRKIVDGYPNDRAVRAQALVRMGECYQKLGDAQAKQVYERVVREFGDQAEYATRARTAIAALASDGGVADAKVTESRRQLHEPEQVAEWGQVSPDGQSMSFNDVGAKSSGNLGVWDLGTGKTRLVTTAPCCEWAEGFVESSIWSPDGRQFAYGWRGQGMSLPPRQDR